MTAMQRFGWLAGSALVLTLSLGCEPGAPPASPAGSQEAAARPAADAGDDAAAIKSFVRQETGTPPAAGSDFQLPPSHPSIGPTSAAARPSGALPAGHPPAAGAAPAPSVVPGELQYAPPADWQPVPPRSTMRKAQFALPKADGDSDDGELIVFYFGPGEGGPTMANLDRWRGQFVDPSGRPLAPDAGQTESFEANGLKVTLLDVSGRYAPGAMPGMPAQGPKDDYRMLAAVVETASGPWFFKATGPQATIARHRDAIRKLLESCRM